MTATPSSLTPFDQLANQMVELGSNCSPSLIQGWLTGYLASSGRLTIEAWMNEAAMLIEPENEWLPEHKSGLLNLLDQTLVDLEDGDMPFQMMLPEIVEGKGDEYQNRLDSLIQWCEGFVTGFGSSGAVKQEDLDEDTVEMLQDLMAISQAEMDPDDPDNGQLIEQVEEHVKVSAYGIFYQFNTPPAPPQSGSDDTIH